jgi:Flp pilus assembly protein TadG
MRDHEQLLGVERDIERLSPPFIEDATRARPALRLVRRRDGLAVGFVLVALLLGGAVAMSIALGWVR